MRLRNLLRPLDAGKRIRLTDQARKLCERIAFAARRRISFTTAIIFMVRRERSALVSISHRDDASLRETR
jgi:hypothetical protein